MARKLEAGFAGRYLMSSVLITSTMKSEPGTPPIRDGSFGVPVSAAATCMVGASAATPACLRGMRAMRGMRGRELRVTALPQRHNIRRERLASGSNA